MNNNYNYYQPQMNLQMSPYMNPQAQPYQNQQQSPFQMFGGYQNFINQFNAFKQQYSGQIPAQMMVQRLLDSGRMTQGQFNAVSQWANLIRGSGFVG